MVTVLTSKCGLVYPSRTRGEEIRIKSRQDFRLCMSPGWRWRGEHSALVGESRAQTEWEARADACFVLGAAEPASLTPWQQ